jgi:endo-1,4-beta-mannosidase
METFILLTVYFAVVTITIPVMRFAFRAELKVLVEETVQEVLLNASKAEETDVAVEDSFDPIAELEIIETSTRKELVPVFHYNTQENTLVVNIPGFTPWEYDMNDEAQSEEAMHTIANWNYQQQKAEEAIEEAQELLFEVCNSIATKTERYRGHEWGTKSKMKK